MSDAERLQRLEQLFRGMEVQMTQLRAELAALRDGTTVSATPAAPPGDAATPAAPPSAPRPRRPAAPAAAPALDFEAIMGRYGAIALATVAILVGVGAFLTWAIAHGLLGPGMRVALGAFGATAVAFTGWRLRERGTVRFGNVVLALSLALLHLDMWGAGPRLHVLPTNVALAITGVASVTLAVLARRENEEVLFAVGLGGALLAPFVVSNNAGSAYVLAVYGCTLIGAGIFGLRTDRWRVALGILGVGGLLYVVTIFKLASDTTTTLVHDVPAAFGLVCAWTVLAWGRTSARLPLALWYLVLAAFALAGAGVWKGVAAVAIGLALLGTLTSYAAPRVLQPKLPARPFAAIVLPLGFLGGAEIVLRHPDSLAGVAIAAAWTLLALIGAKVTPRDRGLHLATAASASAIGVLLGLHRTPELCVIVLALHALLVSQVMRRVRAAALAWPITVELGVASLWAVALLDDRVRYAFPPFLTLPSLAALAVVAAWWVFAHDVRTGWGVTDTRGDTDLVRASLEAMPAIAAFVWIQRELAGAFAADVATFLLIVFYAVAGVAAIFYGRHHAHRVARVVGLALAFYAGIRALAQAWSLDAIGWRVGSCVLVGLFVALVAYWYRGQEGERQVHEAAPLANAEGKEVGAAAEGG